MPGTAQCSREYLIGPSQLNDRRQGDLASPCCKCAEGGSRGLNFMVESLHVASDRALSRRPRNQRYSWQVPVSPEGKGRKKIQTRCRPPPESLLQGRSVTGRPGGRTKRLLHYLIPTRSQAGICL